MKILSNKKYNELILKSCKGMFGAVTDDMLLRNNALLNEENKELKEDISFCLHSIKQEMEMSTDSRTRNEMTSCYEILKRWNK